MSRPKLKKPVDKAALYKLSRPGDAPAPPDYERKEKKQKRS